jgi:selenocysteine lyase/cysteine desulfurase
MRWLMESDVDFAAIHAHVQRLQRRFLDALAQERVPALPLDRFVPPSDAPRGNFLTFALPWATQAEAALTGHRISVDRRGDRLRFGFGVYHDDGFIDRLVERVREALATIPSFEKGS